MGRWIKYVLAGLGALGLVAVIALGVVVYTGVLTPEKIRTVLKYNPLVAQTVAVRSELAIQTNLMRLNRVDISLPAMGEGFVNGAGAVAELPGAGILIGERNGRIFFFTEGDGAPTLTETAVPVATNNDQYETDAADKGYAIKPGLNLGYGGSGMRLLDLLMLKDGRTLLASFTRWDRASACARQHVARTTATATAGGVEIDAWTDVWQAEPCIGLSESKRKPFSGHQSGGRMIEMPDGRILLAIGDYKMDGYHRPLSVADPASDYGKTHVIDLATGQAVRFSAGHRNPQGLDISETGEIWSTEHGPSGGDEVNRIVAGADYGWPMVTLGIDCGHCANQTYGRHDGYEAPVFAYMPSIGISGMIVLKNFAPLWDGDLLHGSLVAEKLFHLRLDGGRVVYSEAMQIGERIRDMIQLADGRVLLWTDTGKLIFLEQDRGAAQSETLAAELSPEARNLLRECAECHDFDAGQGREGKINLWGVIGRKRASEPGADYSDAMRAMGGTWTAEALDSYLANPAAAVPGTNMPYEGVADAELRAELISMLAQLR